jgi:hypothetical protein
MTGQIDQIKTPLSCKKSCTHGNQKQRALPKSLFFFFCLSFNSMVDKKEQQSETPPDGSPPSLRQDDQSKRSDREQQSSNEVHPLHPSTPTRAQQQRHRRNLRLNGQVDVEEGSTARYSLSNERRDSWIDRINSSTKNGKKRPKKTRQWLISCFNCNSAIRRTSTIAAIDEKKLIDKVADSLNQYGEEHKHDSWADKVMDFLFPSIAENSDSASDNKQVAKEMTPFYYTPSPFNGQRTPVMSPSDKSYDKAQLTEPQADLKSWAIETTDTMDVVDQRALNQHPHLGMTAQTSDQAYDEAQSTYPDDQSVQCYADALEEQDQHDSPFPRKPSFSVKDDLKSKQEQHLWPPVQSVDQSPDDEALSLEKEKKDRRRQRQQQRKQQLDGYAC